MRRAELQGGELTPPAQPSFEIDGVEITKPEQLYGRIHQRLVELTGGLELLEPGQSNARQLPDTPRTRKLSPAPAPDSLAEHGPVKTLLARVVGLDEFGEHYRVTVAQAQQEKRYQFVQATGQNGSAETSYSLSVTESPRNRLLLVHRYQRGSLRPATFTEWIELDAFLGAALAQDGTRFQEAESLPALDSSEVATNLEHVLALGTELPTGENYYTVPNLTLPRSFAEKAATVAFYRMHPEHYRTVIFGNKWHIYDADTSSQDTRLSVTHTKALPQAPPAQTATAEDCSDFSQILAAANQHIAGQEGRYH